MTSRLVAAGLALGLSAGVIAAEDKKDKDKPAPVWVRETNGIEITMQFGKDTVKGTVLSGENGFEVKCKTTTDKDGTIKATVTEVTEKGKFPMLPPVGFEFSFKWKIDGDTAELSDLKGDGSDEAKKLVEGEYKKKKK